MKTSRVSLTQAERVLRKFGGARALYRALVVAGKCKDPATIYKWTYPKTKGGTGGLIPTQAWPDVIEAALCEGIILTVEDMDPRPQLVKVSQEEDE